MVLASDRYISLSFGTAPLSGTLAVFKSSAYEYFMLDDLENRIIANQFHVSADEDEETDSEHN